MIARIMQFWCPNLSENCPLPRACASASAPTASATLINAAVLNSRVKNASGHVSFLGHLDHK